MKEAEEDKELDRKAFTNTTTYWPIIECSAKKGDVFLKERKVYSTICNIPKWRC